MAHRKAGGSAKNLTDSNAKYLGTKLYAGQVAKAGSIIIRQRGTKWVPGVGVDIGRDHTIFSIVDGRVRFDREGRRVNVDLAAVAASN